MESGKWTDGGSRVLLDLIADPDAGWVHELLAVADGRIRLAVTAPPSGQRAWRRLLGAALPSGSPRAEEGRGPSCDPAGDGAADECWRFETEAGLPLFSPYFAADAWQRPPYTLVLRLVAERSGQCRVLAEACVGTRDSYTDLLRKLAAMAVQLLSRALSPSPPAPGPLTQRSATAAKTPRAGQLVGGAICRQIQRNARRLAVETWAVGVAKSPIGTVMAGGVIGEVSWLEWDDRKGYLADPFPWPGRPDRILCERYANGSGRGDLVAIDRFQSDQIVHIDIPEECHLSYPGVWCEGEELLLMPESGASRRTMIYRLDEQARAQPWITVADNVGMADPTLFRKDSLYWIAYTDTDIGLHDNLCLLMAERLQGPWRPHPANPVKLDIRSSRPAGPLFQYEGAWYRPAQDCAADYGAALAINRIVELNPTRYREEVVTVLRPDARGPYPHGLHTLSVWGDRLLIDGKRWQRRPRLLLDKLLYRLRRAGDS